MLPRVELVQSNDVLKILPKNDSRNDQVGVEVIQNGVQKTAKDLGTYIDQNHCERNITKTDSIQNGCKEIKSHIDIHAGQINAIKTPTDANCSEMPSITITKCQDHLKKSPIKMDDGQSVQLDQTSALNKMSVLDQKNAELQGIETTQNSFKEKKTPPFINDRHLKYQKINERQINYELKERLRKLKVIFDKVKTDSNWKSATHFSKKSLALDMYDENVKAAPRSQRPVIRRERPPKNDKDKKDKQKPNTPIKLPPQQGNTEKKLLEQMAFFPVGPNKKIARSYLDVTGSKKIQKSNVHVSQFLTEEGVQNPDKSKAENITASEVSNDAVETKSSPEIANLHKKEEEVTNKVIMQPFRDKLVRETVVDQYFDLFHFHNNTSAKPIKGMAYFMPPKHTEIKQDDSLADWDVIIQDALNDNLFREFVQLKNFIDRKLSVDYKNTIPLETASNRTDQKEHTEINNKISNDKENNLEENVIEYDDTTAPSSTLKKLEMYFNKSGLPEPQELKNIQKEINRIYKEISMEDMRNVDICYPRKNVSQLNQKVWSRQNDNSKDNTVVIRHEVNKDSKSESSLSYKSAMTSPAADENEKTNRLSQSKIFKPSSLSSSDKKQQDSAGLDTVSRKITNLEQERKMEDSFLSQSHSDYDDTHRNARKGSVKRTEVNYKFPFYCTNSNSKKNYELLNDKEDNFEAFMSRYKYKTNYDVENKLAESKRKTMNDDIAEKYLNEAMLYTAIDNRKKSEKLPDTNYKKASRIFVKELFRSFKEKSVTESRKSENRSSKEATLDQIKHQLKQHTDSSQNASIKKMQEIKHEILHHLKILTKEPHNAKAYYRRAQARLALKDYDKALKDLKKALTLNPSDILVRTSLEQAKKLKLNYLKKEKKAYSRLFV